MAHDRQIFEEILKEAYGIYYNVIPNDGETELPLAFRCDFLSKGEGYFLIKSAKIWENETNEFLYLFSAPSFTPEKIQECVDYVIQVSEPRVKPHKNHQYTNFIVLFLADEIGAEETKIIKKQNYSRSYNHSLWGYSLLKTGGIDLNTEKVCTNRSGHDLTGFYKKLFAARKEDGHAGRNKKFSLKE